MLKVILYQPEIPPNTGNIIRLCANTGAELHLVHPLGFDLDDKRMRRAGLDYHEFANLKEHQSLEDALVGSDPQRIFALTTHGSTNHCDIQFQANDTLVFGPETRGLPKEFIFGLPEQQRLRIPMKDGSRSLNLSNSVAIMLYEGLRQTGFEGLA